MDYSEDPEWLHVIIIAQRSLTQVHDKYMTHLFWPCGIGGRIGGESL